MSPATHWRDRLLEELGEQQVGEEMLRALMLRLLKDGVIVRGDSQPERRYYDLLLRIERTVEDLLRLLGFTLYIDREEEYARVYAPGASHPTEQEPAVTAEDLGETLAERVRNREAKLALTLLFVYRQSMESGAIDDDGEVSATLEELNITQHNLFGEGLPQGTTERAALLRRMRAWRVIRYDADEAEAGAEAVIVIRPMVKSAIDPHILDELVAQQDGRAADDEVTAE